jgi:hypothetical protein
MSSKLLAWLLVALSLVIALVSVHPVVYQLGFNNTYLRIALIICCLLFYYGGYHLGKNSTTSSVTLTISGHTKDYCMQQLIDILKQDNPAPTAKTANAQ